jgi:hypothetical protein
MPEGESYPNCFGPYLRYAISTEFRDFAFFDEDSRLFFLVEFKQADSATSDPATDFEREMNAAGLKVQFGPADDETRYATLRTEKPAVLQSRAFDSWNKYVSRVELSLPLKPSLLAPLTKKKLTERWNQGKKSPAPLLIGMMDDGCPFAAAQFLRIAANGSSSTRVRGIWDQNQGKQPVPVINGTNTRYFGQALQDFQYGIEFRRDSPTVGQIGLDEWMSLHLTPAGSIDENGCYADARFTRLACQQSHGAHVMDVLAGSIPISSRIGPSYPGGDRRDPPNWAPGNSTTDPACDADVVFVQFSDDCIRDATGVWLKAYVLDGIRYILSFADPNVTKNVIVNLSYGPTTGPHDGTAELESALTALVAEYNRSPGKPKLDIFLAAGNSYLTEEHVVFRGHHNQPDRVEWTWRLPPDNPVLCFAEVWMKSADAGGVIVTLTSPSGAIYISTTATNAQAPAGVDAPLAWGSDDTMWRLQVKPTIAAPGVMAEHGDWTIRVASVRRHAEVHAFVARTDPNMNVHTGAKRSYFVDPEWERTRSAEAGCTRVNGEFDKTGSLVRRLGTLNGIATAEDPRVHVAGGYVLADGRKSPYSSAGPARSGPLTLRTGPDYVLPCDESYALGGIRAGGTRNGSVFRLIGTSIAAPQLARQFAKPTFPQPKNFPTAPPEPEKRGGGDLEPP